MASKPLPPAIIEKGVVCPKEPRTYTTQFGKPISLIETLRSLKVGGSFKIDESSHKWRSRVNAARSYVNLNRKEPIRIKTEKIGKGEFVGMLLITRI